MKRTYRCTLTIAGSDSSAGAGIQADLKTFSALGCYGTSVITTLTAQNTTGVTGIYAVPPSFVEQQLHAIFSDIPIAAIKTGMLYSSDIIRTVTTVLRSQTVHFLVVDPVSVATSGALLLEPSAIEEYKTLLFPLATLITPNIPEATQFSGIEIHSPEDMVRAATILLELGPQAVLVKGGHWTNDESADFLCIRQNGKRVSKWIPGKRIHTKNTHGTGCTLSAAITAFLARGYTLEKAIWKAKKFITGALKEGARYTVGKGYGPVHHFYNYWR
ncbi:MAG: bifunctional hydroxymethylpyrimidine kinase/phosphomethylpyrimidine kinase [Bacteroidetes bacterium]|nr:bifunctional hydroxymethylpyrimidine kinase/phosphomethylpyrimidine kinase [Bacteroidota bacterium]